MDFIQYHNSVAGNRCQVHKIKREKAIAGDIIDEKIMRKRLKRVRQAILFTRFALASARSFHALRGASSPATARAVPRLPSPTRGNRYARL